MELLIQESVCEKNEGDARGLRALSELTIFLSRSTQANCSPEQESGASLTAGPLYQASLKAGILCHWEGVPSLPGGPDGRHNQKSPVGTSHCTSAVALKGCKPGWLCDCPLALTFIIVTTV